jgi:hypothetical protein
MYRSYILSTCLALTLMSGSATAGVKTNKVAPSTEKTTPSRSPSTQSASIVRAEYIVNPIMHPQKTSTLGRILKSGVRTPDVQLASYEKALDLGKAEDPIVYKKVILLLNQYEREAKFPSGKNDRSAIMAALDAASHEAQSRQASHMALVPALTYTPLAPEQQHSAKELDLAIVQYASQMEKMLEVLETDIAKNHGQDAKIKKSFSELMTLLQSMCSLHKAPDMTKAASRLSLLDRLIKKHFPLIPASSQKTQFLHQYEALKKSLSDYFHIVHHTVKTSPSRRASYIKATSPGSSPAPRKVRGPTTQF